jgi:Tol biopolymer transport system component
MKCKKLLCTVLFVTIFLVCVVLAGALGAVLTGYPLLVDLSSYPIVPSVGPAEWSPDSQRIAYVCPDDGKTIINDTSHIRYHTTDADDICVMNRDGTNQRRLTQNGVSDEYPAWSPDGKMILFAFGTKLYVIDPDGNVGPQQIFDWNSLKTAWDVTDVRWSPDGSRIALITCQRARGSDIHILDKSGRYLGNVENPDKAALAYLHWASDGTRLAYVSTLDPNCFGVPSGEYSNSIMIADVQNDFHSHKVVDNLPKIELLAWINQDTLAYNIYLGAGKTKLYSIDLKTDLSTQVQTVRAGYGYAWAPDDTTLAYEWGNAVYLRDLLSGKEKRVWGGQGNAGAGSIKWSPDSQWLLLHVGEDLPPISDNVTTYTRSTASTLWVVSRDGKIATRLTPLMPPDWPKSK